MKKLLIYILFILTGTANLQAQHEGLERHFNTWKLNYTPDTIDSFFSRDTLLENFHLFEPIYRQSIHGGMLTGNNGQAFMPFDYFSRPPLPDFIFRNNYTAYFSRPENVTYFNARKPFTRFDFNSSDDGYEDVQGIFTINATPFLNAGVKYHSIKTDGSFIHSASKNKDFVLWQSFTGRRYQNHFNIIANSQSAQEFGGISNDTAYIDGTRIDNLSVSLNDATSDQKNQHIFFAHEYRLGNMSEDSIYTETDTLLQLKYHGNLSIYQDIKFSRNWRIFSDIPGDNYINVYRDPTATFDSVALVKGTHQAGMQYFGEKDSLKIYRLFAGIINEGKRFHLPSGDELIQNHYVKLSIRSLADTPLEYAANIKYGLAGRRQSDFHSHVDLSWHSDSLNCFSLQSDIRHERANYFYEHYASNHFAWDQKHRNEKELKSRIQYQNKKIELTIRLNHSLLIDPVYISPAGIPKQYIGPVSISGAGIGKDFRLGAFGLRTDLIYQNISVDSVLHVPDILAFGGIYFEHDLFDHNMRLRTGVDARFHSDYKAVTYIPATGFFAPAYDQKLHESLLLDAFLSFKVKRFRAFIRYNNIGGDFLNNAAWSLLHYPQRPSAISFGFSWEFYD
ncbi:MAG: putative porin [Bacteroidales bacterium]